MRGAEPANRAGAPRLLSTVVVNVQQSWQGFNMKDSDSEASSGKQYSVRVDDPLLARIDADAARRSAIAGIHVSRGAAMRALIVERLDAIGPAPSPEPAAKVKARSAPSGKAPRAARGGK